MPTEALAKVGGFDGNMAVGGTSNHIALVRSAESTSNVVSALSHSRIEPVSADVKSAEVAITSTGPSICPG